MVSSTVHEARIESRREHSAHSNERVSILLIGAGPTGLTLANLLGTQGASGLLVERNLSTGHEPRAVSIDDESLRTMHTIGLGDSVLRSIVPGYGSDYLMPSGRCFLTARRTIGQAFWIPATQCFSSVILEAQLQQGML
jgi:3-(3-hydroxy-phenyl)propionate hydroxylase